jgi:hypothetical protein
MTSINTCHRRSNTPRVTSSSTCIVNLLQHSSHHDTNMHRLTPPQVILMTPTHHLNGILDWLELDRHHSTTLRIRTSIPDRTSVGVTGCRSGCRFPFALDIHGRKTERAWITSSLVFGTQLRAFRLCAAGSGQRTVLEDRASLHVAYRTLFGLDDACEPRFKRSVHLECIVLSLVYDCPAHS